MAHAEADEGGDRGPVRQRLCDLVGRPERVDAGPAAPRAVSDRLAALSRERVTVAFEDALLTEEPAASLVEAMRAEIAELYDGLDLDDARMPSARPDELAPPAGALIVGFADGRPVCCGGIKRLDQGTCEIKRMYVLPEMRGRGVARQLLDALESKARALGYDRARLDTGPRQPDARALYESAGYEPVANFNRNPVAVFWGEKQLVPSR